MRKRYLRLLCGLCAAALLLGGCGLQPAGNVDPTGDSSPVLPTKKPQSLIPTSAPSQEQTEQTEPAEPTEPTEPSRELDPVTQLQSIRWRTFPEFLSLGGGNILACRNYFEEGKGIVNYLDIFNVYDDAVIVQSGCSSPRELVDQRFDDGAFVLRDARNNKLFVYDQQLHITQEIPVRNPYGYFSRDRKTYFYVADRVLYRLDLATGNYGRMALEWDLRLQSLIGVHPDRDILVAKVYLSAYDDRCGVCAIDCKTGKLLILKDDVDHLWFDDNTFYAALTNDQTYGVDIVYGSLDGGVQTKVATGFMGGDTTAYTVLPDSGLMVWRSTDENNLSTVIYDLSREGISSKMAQYEYETSTLDAIYLEEEQLIFGLYPENYDFAPVVIDPKVLNYEKSLSLQSESWPALVDRNLSRTYEQEVAGPALPDHLTSMRQRADGLQKRYGVTVLMEQQIMGYWNNATVEADANTINTALDALDRALSLYPDGFFAQFQNGIGEGGVVFCLTGRIHGSLDPVGKAKLQGQNYLIALDITAGEPDRTIHHELWHVIEMKLSTDSFTHPRWRAANPEGFLYYGRYDSGYQDLTQWTYTAEPGNCYFVSAYSRINSREDRATIMEAVMTTDASALMGSAYMKEKLQIISNEIRNQFDTIGWQTPYWERYL